MGRDDERTTLTQQQALTKFGEFIRTFQVDNKSSSFPYAYVDDALWDWVMFSWATYVEGMQNVLTSR